MPLSPQSVVEKLFKEPKFDTLIPSLVGQKAWQPNIGFTSSLIDFHMCFTSQERFLEIFYKNNGLEIILYEKCPNLKP